jgi:hypothetical protein
LGTSHQIQCRWGDASTKEAKLSEELRFIVRELLARYSITLIAEEAPHDVPTVARLVSNETQLPYLQVDMPSGEYERYGIRSEMDMVATLNSRGDADYRCPHADDIRENSWLEKLEQSPSARRVLLVCGYAHTKFVAQKVRDRDCVAEELFFPAELRERKIVVAVNPAFRNAMGQNRLP